MVLYQLLAGRLPYETGSLTELATRQQEGMPEPLHLVNPEVSPELSRAVTALAGGATRASVRERGGVRRGAREAARGRDSAVTMLLETAATRVASAGEQEAATNVLQPVPAPLPQPVPARAASRPSPRAARGRRARPVPSPSRAAGAGRSPASWR